MWIVFFTNPQRVVLCSRAQSDPPAGLDPAETSRAPLGPPPLPSPSRRVSLEFTTSITQSRAAPCLPQAMAGDRTHTHSSAARLSRAAAVTQGQDPSPLRRTSSTGCTPGCGHQVCYQTTAFFFYKTQTFSGL